jgi:hypothetical protein
MNSTQQLQAASSKPVYPARSQQLAGGPSQMLAATLLRKEQIPSGHTATTSHSLLL